MDFQKGERVLLNVDDDNDKISKDSELPNHEASFPAFVGDVLERSSAQSSPPAVPSLNANVNGFPAHRKRVPRMSAFKQRRATEDQEAATATATTAGMQKGRSVRPFGLDANEERKAIDEENRRKVAAMSDQEIEQERQDLMSTLSPALIRKLLMRSNVDEGSNERDLHPERRDGEEQVDEDVRTGREEATENGEKGSLEEASTQEKNFSAQPHLTAPPEHTLQPVSDTTTTWPAHTQTETSTPIHFPSAPQPPDLDPNHPDFLQNLHSKYFPNLPYNPRELSWMAPIDPADSSSPYHPSQTALNPSELRFDFRANLLPPSVARDMPTDKGLHHHADAPEAAGYTIPELAVTARSQVAAQRCIAYQTLGRILYRLGQGEFGVERAKQETDGPVHVAWHPDASKEEHDEEKEGEDVGSAMAAGLWGCIEKGQVIETLTEEANRTKGHLTARTFAQEALWNWRRGGGRKRQAI